LSKFDSVDSDEFRDTVWLAVRFLDDVVSVNKYPLPQIEEVALSLRPIGLGVMGFADYLIQKGIRYDSSEAIAEAEGVARTLRHYAFEASEALGKEKGFYKPTADRRNCEVLSIAPTGTISIIAGCSPSIEPWFDKATLHSYGKDRLDITSDIARDNPSWVVTAAEVSPTQHIHIQAAFQKYVDSGVSKTINLPFEATVEDIEDAFRLSWRLNCKGLTVYRDRSRREQVLYPKMVSRERATTTHGVTTKYDVGCGHIYVTVNSDEKGLCEVFATVGKGGGCPSQTEGMSRLVSLCLRAGVNPSEIVRQLKGIRCFSTLKRNGASALSCPDAVARALSVEEEVPSTPTDITCPECGSPLSAAEGCRCCIQCGWSRCG
jgi:ribonucleoside-diphosphate reductase alpha chain